MDAVAAKKVIVTAAILAIVSAFQNGLTHLEKKEYDQAVKEFTFVIEKDVPGNTLRELAYYYRAQAHMGNKNNKAAREDLLTLLDMTEDETLIVQAETLFKKAGGKVQLLQPVDSPRKTWQKFVAAAQQGNMDKALGCCVGQMYGMVKYYEALAKRGNFNVMQTFTNLEVVEDKIKDDKEEATLSLTGHNGRMSVTVTMVKRKRRWMISTYEMAWQQHGGAVRAQPANEAEARQRANKTRLKQLGLAMAMWANDHNEHFPAKVEELYDDYTSSKDIFKWVNPKTGKEMPFVYFSKSKPRDPPELMIAASPLAIDGKRMVLFYDGHVEEVDDKQFLANAKKQKWVLPGWADKSKVDPKLKAKIKELIGQLGAENYKVRREARKALGEIGPEAIPILQEYRNHPDPEIRLTVKELLEK